VGWLRRYYGADALHLVVLLSCFAFSGYIATRVAGAPGAARIGLWFGGAVIGHDLVLYPLYMIVDRTVRPHPSRPRSSLRVLATNHIRVPALISGLLLLVWFPEIARRSRTYPVVTGLDASGYLGRWLAVTGVLFGGSALVLAIRLGVRSRR